MSFRQNFRTKTSRLALSLSRPLYNMCILYYVLQSKTKWEKCDFVEKDFSRDELYEVL